MRLRQTLFFVPLAALAFVAAACGGGEESGEVPSNAVAVIDKCDRPITRNDFNQVVNQAKTNYKKNKQKFPDAGSSEFRAVQNQIVSYLVLREGYICEGEQLDLEVSNDEIDKRLDELVQQYYKGDEGKFKKALEEQGVAEEQLRKELSMQLFQRKIFDKVTGEVKVTDKEIEDYYKKNKEQYTNAATRTVRHILVKKNQRALADQLLGRLRAGASFAALAKRYSTDPGSKKNGGKLDLAQGQTVPAFDKVAFKLKKGQTSEPVRTQFGWHIIRAETAVKPADTQTLAEVRDSIREIIVQSKKTEKGQKWSEDFRKRLQTSGAVDYQVGYEPPKTTTGATTGAAQTTAG